MCIEAVNRISQVWETADDEDRKGMAQYLFSEVVYNLDTRRIESFQLKPWADEFIMLRVELYRDEFGDLEEGSDGYDSAVEKADSNNLLGCWNPMPHRNAVESQAGKKASLGEKSARGTGSAKQREVDRKPGMKAEGRWKGSGARATSRQLVRLILQQQGEDKPDQLTGGQDEGTAMLKTDSFAILALVERLIVRGVEADTIGTLDEIVTQIAVAGLGQVAGFTMELAGVDARPPETGEPGKGGLPLMNQAKLAVRLGHKAVHILDFGQQAGGIHRANAGDRLEVVIAG
jgi:hypothetical protein